MKEHNKITNERTREHKTERERENLVPTSSVAKIPIVSKLLCPPQKKEQKRINKNKIRKINK